MTYRSPLGAVVVGVIVGTAGPAADASRGITVPIDPTATFLLTHQDPDAAGARPIDLEEVGLKPGDNVALRAVGDLCFSVFDPRGCANAEIAFEMIGVFSATSSLLAPNLLNRVPDAIAAGTPTLTFVTLFDQLPTDIGEDFVVAHSPFSSVVTIPEGARYLFVAVKDSFYGDNDDPDGDLAVTIDRVPSRISFSANSDTVAGADTGAAQIAGGGSFEVGRNHVQGAGAFRCTQSFEQWPLLGCLAGEGVRWSANELLTSVWFQCSGVAGESFKQAFTGAAAVVILVDFYLHPGGEFPTATKRVIFADSDIAPDVTGVQNVWIEGVGCGAGRIAFNASFRH
jgi:hypothetical protein